MLGTSIIGGLTMQRESIDFTYHHLGYDFEVTAEFTRLNNMSEWDLEDVTIEGADGMDCSIEADKWCRAKISFGKVEYIPLLTFINDKARERWAAR